MQAVRSDWLAHLPDHSGHVFWNGKTGCYTPVHIQCRHQKDRVQQR